MNKLALSLAIVVAVLVPTGHIAYADIGQDLFNAKKSQVRSAQASRVTSSNKGTSSVGTGSHWDDTVERGLDSYTPDTSNLETKLRNEITAAEQRQSNNLTASNQNTSAQLSSLNSSIRSDFASADTSIRNELNSKNSSMTSYVNNKASTLESRIAALENNTESPKFGTKYVFSKETTSENTMAGTIYLGLYEGNNTIYSYETSKVYEKACILGIDGHRERLNTRTYETTWMIFTCVE